MSCNLLPKAIKPIKTTDSTALPRGIRQISICAYYYKQNQQRALVGFHQFQHPKKAFNECLGVSNVFLSATSVHLWLPTFGLSLN